MIFFVLYAIGMAFCLAVQLDGNYEEAGMLSREEGLRIAGKVIFWPITLIMWVFTPLIEDIRKFFRTIGRS